MKTTSTRTTFSWHFNASADGHPATGEFFALHADRMGRLYYPIFNEAGMLSWVSPKLQGSPAASHNEYLGVPLTAEDLPNTLVHRGFWLVENRRSPFSLSALSPEGLQDNVGSGRAGPARVDAGPGWFSLTREEPLGRYLVRATIWCPADADSKLEIMHIEVIGQANESITLSPYAAVPIYARSADDVRDHRHVTALLHRVRRFRNGIVVRPTMSFDERGHKINHISYGVFAAGPGGTNPLAVWPTQESFLGLEGSFAAPSAVWRGERAPNLKPCEMQGKEALSGFLFQDIALSRGDRAEFIIVSGITDDARECRTWARLAANSQAVARSLASTRKYWMDRVQRIAFLTPDTNLNPWLAWVNFQPILRRWYGNSYLPQFDYGRGGKGWRDLWQDCLALLLSDPSSVREMLLHNFAGVRIDGSNATIIGKGATFIADRNNIPRTWMDHGCWPTYTTLLYIDQTGDFDFLLEPQTYFRDAQIYRCRRRDAQWSEAQGRLLRTQNGRIYRGTVFEHMLVQNLTAFFNVGEHNVCRLEGADWNDGLDMAADRGESVAFSAFYAWNLSRLADTAEALAARGHRRIRLAGELRLLLDRLPGQRAVNYKSARAKIERLNRYLEMVARDPSGQMVEVAIPDLVRDLRAKSHDLGQRIRGQEWVNVAPRYAFFNGYYDNNGRRVEGRRGKIVRMTLPGQVFPIMSGLATDVQVDAVIASARRFLRDPASGGMRLNTDFGDIQPALGRAFSFAYGEKENGAVFSHMAVMYAFALYMRRRPEEGRSVWHTLYRMACDPRAGIFPCIPEYFNAQGRGMYCYLTGSASWLIYLLLTQVFGVRGQEGDLLIDPQLTREDFMGATKIAVRAFFADKPLIFEFQNPAQLQPGAYRVGRLLRGDEPVDFEPQAEGGARIARSWFSKLPAQRDSRLVVELVRR